GNLSDQSTQLLFLLEQRDTAPCPRRGHRSLHTGRPASDDKDLFRSSLPPNSTLVVVNLPTQKAIDAAAHGGASQRSTTAKSTSDAPDDRGVTPFQGLVGKIRIGKQLAANPQEIDDTALDDVSRKLWIIDAGAPNDRHADGPFDRFVISELVARW